MLPRYSIVTSSIRGHDYTICITQSQIHLFNQHKGPQRVPQSSTGESRRKRVPTLLGKRLVAARVLGVSVARGPALLIRRYG